MMFNPLSVTDYLASVARTPTPTRFDRRHQRILEGKPRLARVSRIIHKDARSADELQNRPQGKQNCQLDAFAVALPPDIEPPESPAINTTLKSTIEIEQIALINFVKQSDRSQRSGSGFEDEGACSEDQAEQESIQNDHHLPDADAQEEDSGMFISTDSM
jgi:hypothetical protein